MCYKRKKNLFLGHFYRYKFKSEPDELNRIEPALKARMFDRDRESVKLWRFTNVWSEVRWFQSRSCQSSHAYY